MPLRRSLLLAALAAPTARAQNAAPIALCAATGLRPGLAALEPLWRAQGGRPWRLTWGSSAALARQLEQGAACDLLALADAQRMDALDQRRLLKPESRRDLLGNDLVLVTAADQPLARRPAGPAELPELLREGRLALPDPAQTAAGRTAREALGNLGLWEALAPRLLPLPEAAAALEAVRKGEARFGIAYGTEAMEAAGLRLAYTFPAESHAAIRYPFALGRRADAGAAELLAFLAGPDAAAVWRRQGFAPR